MAPCPFCGSPHAFAALTPKSQQDAAMRVICNCGAEGPKIAVRGPENEKKVNAQRDAVLAWNKRA
jgi:Lar family restriction alleviation protein